MEIKAKMDGNLWKYLKGTSRGLETVESNMNDYYYKSVLCWQ